MNKVFSDLTISYPELSDSLPEIESAAAVLVTAFRSGNKLLICGNGGSASDAEHIVGELMKGFLLRRSVPMEFRQRLREQCPSEADFLADRLQGALPAIALGSHTALTTAFANDVAPELVFAQQVYGYGKPGDVLLVLSTSGNSKNVVQALRVARAIGVGTIGLTGKSGGEVKKLSDVTIRVPYDATPQIQERHLPIYHALCIYLENVFFGEN
jgi:phosphoheptose isomerase